MIEDVVIEEETDGDTDGESGCATNSTPVLSLLPGKNGTVQLALGSSLQLSIPSGSGFTVKSVKSSRTKVATVSAGGLVTPKKAGSATITVTAVCGKVKATASVVVNVYDPRTPTAIRLDQTGTNRLAIGQTLQLTGAVSPSTAVTKVTWSTSNKKVATVSNGLVKALKAGKATITATTSNKKKASVVIEVYNPETPTAVALNYAGTISLPLNMTLQLAAALAPSTAKSTLKWTTSNKKIATVSASGLVTPKKTGTATITVATANGKKAAVKVKVVAAVATPAPTVTPTPTIAPSPTVAPAETDENVLVTTTQQDLIADLSHYDGNIDWNATREILDFTILRASCGLTTDTKYAYNAKTCAIPFGAYHYVKAGTIQDAIEEANYFYKTATRDGIQPLFFVADIEYSAQTQLTTDAVTDAFLRQLRALGAPKLGLYISQDRYVYLDDAKANVDFLWLPRWGKDDGDLSAVQKPAYACDLWQYTSRGYLPGVSTDVDLNVVTGRKSLSWFMGTIKQTIQSRTQIVVTGSSVNIRTGASGDYKSIKVATKGQTLTPILDSKGNPIQSNGWYAVRVNNQVAWISGKLSCVS